MKTKLIWLWFVGAALLFNSCKKDEENTGRAASNGGTQYGVVTTPEGCSFEITYPDGTTEVRTGTSVSGWNGGQLLNLNFFRQLSIYDGQDSWFLRFSMVQGTDWENEVLGEHDLYDFPFLLQWSADMDETVVEFYSPNNDEIEGNSYGTVVLTPNIQVAGSTYELYGEVDASFTVYGQTTTVSGAFWAQELD